MAEFRKVELTRDARDRGLTSTYHYDNLDYFLSGVNILNVRQEVAASWISADSNVKLLANG